MVPSIERVARLVRAVRHAGMSTNVDKGCALLARHFGAEADELLCDLLSGRASSLWAEAVPSLLQRLEVLGYSVECLLPNGRILINVGEGPGLMVCVHDAESTAAPGNASGHGCLVSVVWEQGSCCSLKSTDAGP